MRKEKTLIEKIIFIDNLIDSTFSKKTYLFYRDIIDEYEHQEKEIKRLNNIIKEVREYIENNLYSDYGYPCIKSQNELLQILDKGSID